MVQQIDRLEETLGFSLFLRNNQGVILTGEGEIFYRAVLEMKKTYESALRKIKGGKQNKIYIGDGFESVPGNFLMDGCSVFQKKISKGRFFILKELAL